MPRANPESHDDSDAEVPRGARPRELNYRGTLIAEIIRRWRLKFSGEVGEDPEEFLEDLKQHQQYHGIEDLELIDCVAVCLGGTAKRWHKRRGSRSGSWEEFAAAFREFFGDPEYQFNLERNIRERFQDDAEPVREYVMAMTTMFDKLQPRWSEERMVRTLYERAKLSLRQTIVRKSLRTVDDAADRLVEEDRIEERSKRGNPKPSEMVHSSLAFDTNRYSRAKSPGRGRSVTFGCANAVSSASGGESDESGDRLPRSFRRESRTGSALRKPRESVASKQPSTTPGGRDRCRSGNRSRSTSRDPPTRTTKESAAVAVQQWPRRDKPRATGKYQHQCWNCHKTGHLSRDCREEPQLHCYGCGAEGITINRCRRYSKRSGNEGGSRSRGQERLHPN
ncbi:uncharacterized protein LOC143218518 [Lasioglossum baleicum]|uniref:uncharacterized protein LOC143218518 n=1 Tax=Lasioglossum baleicum TaxID=434251 RepID=UPI003FCD2E20